LGQALELVGLDPNRYLERAVDRTLSDGERKRIELASILTMAPQLVLMDEPDSGIDVDALQRIFEAIRFLKEKGTTVLLITHSATVLEQADHAFLLCCGKLVEKGPVDKIMKYFGEKCIPCDHQNQPDLERTDEKR
jgi:Fe-S cluster assembly ATP-binding protein